jgi:protocatechuate 3,4-dioxygenase beta subunit
VRICGGDPRVVQTDNSGTYRIESLLPGKYTQSSKMVLQVKF